MHNELAEQVAAAVVRLLPAVLPAQRRWLNNAQAAAYLGFANGNVLSSLRTRGLDPPHHGCGRMLRYNVAQLDEWVRGLPTRDAK
jgi:hypothetical protein